MAIFTGCAVALITPFYPNGDVDFESFHNLIEWQISEGIDAILVCSTIGEASTLNQEEHIKIIQFCVNIVNKRIPVIGGVGSNNTNQAIALTKAVEQTGVDGLFLIPPYYNQYSQVGLIEHYLAIANAVKTPCLLYSSENNSKINIAPQAISILSAHPNIVGITENRKNISLITEIMQLVPNNFAIYSGSEDMIIPLMSLGGKGCISTIANIMPSSFHKIIKNFMHGNLIDARNIQLNMKNLIDCLSKDINSISIKAALYLMNKCQLEYRLPFCPPNNLVMDKIENEMILYNLIKKF